MKISLLINMKMPTIVGICIIISRENFILSWGAWKYFITSGLGRFSSILQGTCQETTYVTSCLLSCKPSPFWKRGLPKGSKLFPFWVDPFSEGRLNNFDIVASPDNASCFIWFWLVSILSISLLDEYLAVQWPHSSKSTVAYSSYGR